MEKTRIKLITTIFVIDAELGLIVDKVETPCDRPRIGEGKAKEKADEYAKQTGHSVCVTKPISWH